MNLLTLNIIGFGSEDKITELKKLCRKEKIHLLALQETLLFLEIGPVIIQLWTHSELGYTQQLAQGRSGGLLFLWNKQM